MSFTLAQARKAMFPQPVFTARFVDGSVGSMTFFSESGKPLDLDRGRRLVEHAWARPLSDWHVTIDGAVVAQGTAGDIEAKPAPKPRETVAELRRQIAELERLANALVRAWPEEPTAAARHPAVRAWYERLAA